MTVNLGKVPETPGVYKFFHNNEIIYIGKAKNLKKRVSSYFGKSLKDRKTYQIKILTEKVETFSTKNEVEALLLEQSLIKENKPRFNILLRDDKTYPYIFFSQNHEFPGIYLKRTKAAVNEDYFGPFTSAGAVKKSIREIQKIFQIRNCNDSTFNNRSRPCIEYQMKRCSAPCVNKINPINYNNDVVSAQNYISSTDKNSLRVIKAEITKASKKLNYERAAELRDQLKRINLIKEEQGVTTYALDIDIFSVDFKFNYIGISIVSVRSGKIRGTKTHLIKKAFYNESDEIFFAAILNFYKNKIQIPNKILTNRKLRDSLILSHAIENRFQKKVKFISTASKSLKPILSLCNANAKQVIENHLSKRDKYNFAFNELALCLGRKKIQRIDAFDVSHLSGNHAVTSCVVFDENGPVKNAYRSFNIPNEIAGDDLKSLAHTLERRIKRYNLSEKIPDIILIDGGKNQLNIALKILNNSDFKNVSIISIVKGINRIRATETILSKDGIVEIGNKSQGYRLLQEIRDESHRFAITAQRKKKQKTVKLSILDEITGIGSVTKTILLRHFKTLRNIKNAKINDFIKIGVKRNIAESIYNRFHEK